MGKIKLCDCTLSVGGSVISWDFGNSRTSVMTEHDIWFHKAPNAEELELLTREVDAF